MTKLGDRQCNKLKEKKAIVCSRLNFAFKLERTTYFSAVKKCYI